MSPANGSAPAPPATPVPPGMAMSGNLAGATFRFATDAAELDAYARIHLAPLLAASSAVPDVTATLRWHEGQPPRARLAGLPELDGMERIDRDLYVGSGRLHWFRVDDLRDLFLHVTWKDGRLTVEGDFFYRVANDSARDLAKRWLYRRRVGLLRRRRFTTLLSYLLYYPCWWWLEQMRGRHPLHAGGVELGSGVVLLGGASGVGKSTLAVALAGSAAGRLLADSFVLHSGTDVFGIPEPVLLDDWSRTWLGAFGRELQPLHWRYTLDRAGYQLPPQRLATHGRAVLLLLPRRAPQAAVRRIDPEEAHRRLSAADLIINDLRRYWAFAAVLEQLAPAGLVMRRETQLMELTRAVPCYEVGLTAALACGDAVESITRLLREVSPSDAVARRHG